MVFLEGRRDPCGSPSQASAGPRAADACARVHLAAAPPCYQAWDAGPRPASPAGAGEPRGGEERVDDPGSGHPR